VDVWNIEVKTASAISLKPRYFNTEQHLLPACLPPPPPPPPPPPLAAVYGLKYGLGCLSTVMHFLM
jgi:hypothetical protein